MSGLTVMQYEVWTCEVSELMQINSFIVCRKWQESAAVCRGIPLHTVAESHITSIIHNLQRCVQHFVYRPKTLFKSPNFALRSAVGLLFNGIWKTPAKVANVKTQLNATLISVCWHGWSIVNCDRNEIGVGKCCHWRMYISTPQGVHSIRIPYSCSVHPHRPRH